MEAKKEENLPDWYSQVTYHTFLHVQYSKDPDSGSGSRIWIQGLMT
jgi:hypothetical protein